MLLRTKQFYNPENPVAFKAQLQLWAQQFDDVLWLDSNQHEQKYGSFEAILAVDAFTSIQTDYYDAFEQLKDYQTTTKDWIFGYLSYDLKNTVEDLRSDNFDGLGFPDLYFFQPKKIFLIKKGQIEIRYLNLVSDEIERDLNDINVIEKAQTISKQDPIKIHLRIHKDGYFEKLQSLLQHIHRGDIYEANFCQEFYAEDTEIDPIEIYNKLNAISNPPFASFLKCFDQYLLSASPERYLKKTGDLVLSQPIKGTARRSESPEEDKALKERLANDTKERSENIMIVDLVRNDLSKTAIKGSVEVAELCQIYSFDQVHQMISTITAKVEKEMHPVDIIKTTFPMGSMTGAPKISAMKIIEELEETKRGLYSGAVGYFTPENDFDFNVVIRSILYNSTKQYVSYSVGSAITAKSDPMNEYEECLVKAKAMRTVLEQ